MARGDHLGAAVIGQLEKNLGRGYPGGLRGQTLLTAADFSGTHAGSRFTSYAFLTVDLDRNADWLAAQQAFRHFHLKKRRMSYKALNDAMRRRALPAFLLLSDLLIGALTIVIIPHDFGTLIAEGDHPSDDLLGLWKPGVHEHVLRVTHLGGMITAHLSRPGQNVFVITDQDEIASNVAQLTQLTKLFGQTIGNASNHAFGHLRVGTTKSDDGSLRLEDLAAVADLSAGAVCDVLSAMAQDGHAPSHGIITPLPRHASVKSRLISMWLSKVEGSLRRSILFLKPPKDGAESFVQSIALKAFTGGIVLADPLDFSGWCGRR